MDDAALVSSGETRADLTRNLDGFIEGEAANPADEGRQVLAVNIFHREKRSAVRVADIEHTANVGMRHLAGDTNFRMKTRQRCCVGRKTSRKKLNGDELREF